MSEADLKIDNNKKENTLNSELSGALGRIPNFNGAIVGGRDEQFSCGDEGD